MVDFIQQNDTMTDSLIVGDFARAHINNLYFGGRIIMIVQNKDFLTQELSNIYTIQLPGGEIITTKTLISN